MAGHSASFVGDANKVMRPPGSLAESLHDFLTAAPPVDAGSR